MTRIVPMASPKGTPSPTPSAMSLLEQNVDMTEVDETSAETVEPPCVTVSVTVAVAVAREPARSARGRRVALFHTTVSELPSQQEPVCEEELQQE